MHSENLRIFSASIAFAISFRLSEPIAQSAMRAKRNEIAPERLALFRQLRSDSKTADIQIQGISQAKERWSALATKPSKR